MNHNDLAPRVTFHGVRCMELGKKVIVSHLVQGEINGYHPEDVWRSSRWTESIPGWVRCGDGKGYLLFSVEYVITMNEHEGFTQTEVEDSGPLLRKPGINSRMENMSNCYRRFQASSVTTTDYTQI